MPSTPASHPRRFRPATEAVHGGTLRSQFGETSEAMFLTQGYVYPDAEAAEARFKGEDPGFVYSRYANPTVAMFEERMCLLEGAEASRAMASGMAAVTAALLCDLKAGDHVVSSRALFGSCQYVIADFLPRFGVAATLVDGTDLDAWREAVRPQARAFFLESPSNPTLELIDIAAVAEIAIGRTYDVAGPEQPVPQGGAGVAAVVVILLVQPRHHTAGSQAVVHRADQPVTVFEPHPNGRYFPETGQTVSGRLLEYWNQNGGLPVFGLPLTPEAEQQTNDGRFRMQQFERNRLELHPENARPYDVLLGRLGTDILYKQGRPWETLPREQPRPGCRFFGETGHNLCEPFLSYWRSHGLDLGDPGISERESLALFGYPVTSVNTETNPDGWTGATQWFERARFESHPENPNPYKVLLGRLGAE